jgi:hypothetical protein
MNPKIAILHLPGEFGFLAGKYGLEQCLARGIIRIHLNSITMIKSLNIELTGTITSHIWDSLDSRLFSMKRTKLLFQEFAVLLQNFDCSRLDTKWFDVPFELQFPCHDEIPFGFGPSSQLLPCSLKCSGKGGWKDDYEAKIGYCLKAVLTLPSTIPFLNAEIVEEVAIAPFLIWDPRLMALIMHTDERIWKSHVGAKPIEYEIEVGSMVFGPNDVLKFSYRMLVNSQFARCGIRIRKVQFILKEYHWIGEDRCCVKDDQHDWAHGRPFRVRGQRELCRWAQIEYPPPEPSSPVDPNISYPTTTLEKYDGLAIFNRKFPGNDGIYVERSGELEIPDLKDFNPSTARPLQPVNDNVCDYLRPRKAFVSIRHTITCVIEMRGADTISIESGCYLAGISAKDCFKLLDTDPSVVPTLDYQKFSGISELDHWVPEYCTDVDNYTKEEDSFYTANDLSRDDCLSVADPDSIEILPRNNTKLDIRKLKVTIDSKNTSDSASPSYLTAETGSMSGNESIEKISVSTRETRKPSDASMRPIIVSPFQTPLSATIDDEIPSCPPPDYYTNETLREPRLRYPARNFANANTEILDLTPNENVSTVAADFNLKDRIADAMDSTFFEI